jgi:hypothetical protein
MSLAELFPDGDYRLHLKLRRSAPRDFFVGQDPSGSILPERARWLASKPERYAAILPPGEPVLAEFQDLAASWGGLNFQSVGEVDLSRKDHRSPLPLETLRRLGAALEPDILFLTVGTDGAFRLQGGALCFPTGWALQEKLGHTLEFIHGVVPGLNPTLGTAIQQFMSKLKPDVAFLRDNWGIAATQELNLHPDRGLPPPEPPVALDRLWLRVERQALMALPQTRGIVFGIRIELHRLDTLVGTPAGTGLKRALETMPAELLAYKRLSTTRPQIVGML